MKIAVIGATGFIGKHVTGLLNTKDAEVTAVTRTKGKSSVLFSSGINEFVWDGKDSSTLIPLIESVDMIINLAGEDISNGRWTERRKKTILSSRLEPAKAIAEAIRKSKKTPIHWVQVSAIGIYGNNYDSNNTDTPGASGFLSEVCTEWEKPAMNLKSTNSISILRLGIVLGRDSGMLKKVTPLFNLYMGGHLGNGRQWNSWIHIDDVASAIKYIADNRLEGTFDLVAPDPVTQKMFFQTLGKVLNRPSRAHVPSFVLRGVFGKMADETILSSIKVTPDKLLESGFGFEFPVLEDALKDLN